jgi:hypothetical protein
MPITYLHIVDNNRINQADPDSKKMTRMQMQISKSDLHFADAGADIANNCICMYISITH